MGIVYHGSSEHGIKELQPRKSTHGEYVYATPIYLLAIHFSKRCGDDLVYDIGHFGTDSSSPWQLVEKVPGALEKMYSTSSSIYTLPDDTFKDIHTGFNEVVSDVGVKTLTETYIDNLYEEIKRLESTGELIIYRYPNLPDTMRQDHTDILDKWRLYKSKYGRNFEKHNFDRLIFLHPELLVEANALAREFGYPYSYKKEDLIDIFKERVDRQLHDLEHEQYIDCAYQMIMEVYPELESMIKPIYDGYLYELDNIKKVSL